MRRHTVSGRGPAVLPAARPSWRAPLPSDVPAHGSRYGDRAAQGRGGHGVRSSGWLSKNQLGAASLEDIWDQQSTDCSAKH